MIQFYLLVLYFFNFPQYCNTWLIVDLTLNYLYILQAIGHIGSKKVPDTHTHTHNRFTALLEYVRDHPGEQLPER